MNKRRLLKMADFVETIPPEEFEMSMYMADRDCGTVGCALGWATQKKVFRGLTNPDYPTFDGQRGINAAQKLFDIPSGAAWALFDESSFNNTPEQVSKNIRRYVETGELP